MNTQCHGQSQAIKEEIKSVELHVLSDASVTGVGATTRGSQKSSRQEKLNHTDAGVSWRPHGYQSSYQSTQCP